MLSGPVKQHPCNLKSFNSILLKLKSLHCLNTSPHMPKIKQNKPCAKYLNEILTTCSCVQC